MKEETKWSLNNLRMGNVGIRYVTHILNDHGKLDVIHAWKHDNSKIRWILKVLNYKLYYNPFFGFNAFPIFNHVRPV